MLLSLFIEPLWLLVCNTGYKPGSLSNHTDFSPLSSAHHRAQIWAQSTSNSCSKDNPWYTIMVFLWEKILATTLNNSPGLFIAWIATEWQDWFEAEWMVKTTTATLEGRQYSCSTKGAVKNSRPVEKHIRRRGTCNNLLLSCLLKKQKV